MKKRRNIFLSIILGLIKTVLALTISFAIVLIVHTFMISAFGNESFYVDLIQKIKNLL